MSAYPFIIALDVLLVILLVKLGKCSSLKFNAKKTEALGLGTAHLYRNLLLLADNKVDKKIDLQSTVRVITYIVALFNANILQHSLFRVN